MSVNSSLVKKYSLTFFTHISANFLRTVGQVIAPGIWESFKTGLKKVCLKNKRQNGFIATDDYRIYI